MVHLKEQEQNHALFIDRCPLFTASLFHCRRYPPLLELCRAIDDPLHEVVQYLFPVASHGSDPLHHGVVVLGTGVAEDPAHGNLGLAPRLHPIVNRHHLPSWKRHLGS